MLTVGTAFIIRASTIPELNKIYGEWFHTFKIIRISYLISITYYSSTHNKSTSIPMKQSILYSNVHIFQQLHLPSVTKKQHWLYSMSTKIDIIFRTFSIYQLILSFICQLIFIEAGGTGNRCLAIWRHRELLSRYLAAEGTAVSLSGGRGNRYMAAQKRRQKVRK